MNSRPSLFSNRFSYHQRRYRDRSGRDRDSARRRERSADRRDDAYYRGSHREYRDRDRRSSAERHGVKPRSPDRRRNRSRESDVSYRSRDDSRDRARPRRDAAADAPARGLPRRPPQPDRAKPIPDEVCCSVPLVRRTLSYPKSQTPVGKPSGPQSDADKKAERLAKLEAWKKKKESESLKQKEQNPGQINPAIKLLAEMDRKANMESSIAASPNLPSAAVSSASLNDGRSPTTAPPSSEPPYAGKFDPKEMTKKSAAAARSHDPPKPVLDSLDVQPQQAAVSVQQEVAGKFPLVVFTLFSPNTILLLFRHMNVYFLLSTSR